MSRQESGERTGQRGKIPNPLMYPISPAQPGKWDIKSRCPPDNSAPLWTPLIQTAKRGRPPFGYPRAESHAARQVETHLFQRRRSRQNGHLLQRCRNGDATRRRPYRSSLKNSFLIQGRNRSGSRPIRSENRKLRSVRSQISTSPTNPQSWSFL